MYYLLDKDLNFISPIENYQSMIWTTRYYESGDFELYIPVTSGLLDLIHEDFYIIRDDDFTQAMIIENIQITTDIEEGNHLIVTGKSLKSILDRRIIWKQTTVRGTVEECIHKLIEDNIVNPTVFSRKIDNFVLGAKLGITETMRTQYTGDNLGEVIREICISYGLGYDVLLDLDEKQFIFILFKGADRTYNQNENAYIVFSNEFENLLSTNYTKNRENFKNAALVAGEGEGINRKRVEVFSNPRTKLDNLLINGDFENGFVGWYADDDKVIVPGEGLNSSNAVKISPKKNYTYIDSEYVTIPQNHIAYMSGYCKVSSLTIPVRLGFYNATNSIESFTLYNDLEKEYIKLSHRFENTRETTQYRALLYGSVTKYTVGQYAYWDNVIVVDLTAIFGAGNEPSKEWCDKNIDMFNGEVLATIEPSGLERYELYVDSRDSSSTSEDSEEVIPEEEYNAILTEKGKEALSEYTTVEAVEGDVETNHTYQYNRDFFLGDIVEVVNEYGHTMQPQIIEVIESEEDSGKSVVVTFANEIEKGG